MIEFDPNSQHEIYPTLSDDDGIISQWTELIKNHSDPFNFNSIVSFPPTWFSKQEKNILYHEIPKAKSILDSYGLIEQVPNDNECYTKTELFKEVMISGGWLSFKVKKDKHHSHIPLTKNDFSGNKGVIINKSSIGDNANIYKKFQNSDSHKKHSLLEKFSWVAEIIVLLFVVYEFILKHFF